MPVFLKINLLAIPKAVEICLTLLLTGPALKLGVVQCALSNAKLLGHFFSSLQL
jgi:hypothetical protein